MYTLIKVSRLNTLNKTLAMNTAHIDHLCDLYALGSALNAPTSVTGGLHHTMWKLDTAKASFAVKQLAADLDANQESVVRHFESTEAVATEFAKQGIPAVHALECRGHFLQVIDGAGYLVYPWVEARALHREAIDLQHVGKVAQVFAALHQVDVNMEGLDGEDASVLKNEQLLALVEFAHSRNSSRASELEQLLPLFGQMIERHAEATRFLAGNTRISHGDMDHKNVLWTENDSPLVIDWESAHRLNPTHEIVLEALDWSGITLDFNEQIFDHFIATYLRAGGVGSFVEVEAAFHCVLGDWLNWLMYNVGRSIDMDDEQQRQIGTEQLDHALATILRLQKWVPRLLAKVH